MSDESNFSFDFSDVWYIDSESNYTYPQFQWLRDLEIPESALIYKAEDSLELTMISLPSSGDEWNVFIADYSDEMLSVIADTIAYDDYIKTISYTSSRFFGTEDFLAGIGIVQSCFQGADARCMTSR